MWLEFLLIANVNDTWQEPLKWGKCTKWSRSWCRPNYLVKSACPIQAINVQFEMPFECGRKPIQVQQIWQIWPRGTDMRGPTHNISVSNIARAFSTLKVIGPGCIHILLDTLSIHKCKNLSITKGSFFDLPYIYINGFHPHCEQHD